MFRVGINALYIKWGVNAGTETYFTNIVKPWYLKNQTDVAFTLYCNEPPPWWVAEKTHFNIKIFPNAKNLKHRLFIEQILFPFSLNKQHDVLFNPGYVGSLCLQTPQVTTIHDGFAWVHPKEIGLLRSIYWRTFIPLTARRARKIIAVSKNTAQDIKQFCGINQDKIEVIYEGGGHYNKNYNSNILNRLNVDKHSYFHCLGFFKNIKNPFRILEAFKHFKENSSSSVKLLLAGHVSGLDAQKILEFALSIDDVLYLGRISDEEVAELYENSLGLIFPSLYEGFGIPILEAQSFNCPVVTSNTSAMPEIAGNGAILVDPLSVEDIEMAYGILVNGQNKDLIKLGRINLENFSWNKASDQTLAVLQGLDEKGF